MNAPKKYYRIALFGEKNFIDEITDEEFHKLLRAYELKACYPLRNYSPALPDDIAYICGPMRNVILLEMNRGHF